MKVFFFHKCPLNIKRFALLLIVCKSFSQDIFTPLDLTQIRSNRLPYRFDRVSFPGGNKNCSYYPLDLDNDRSDEILTIALEEYQSNPNNPNYILARALDTSTLFQILFYGDIGFSSSIYDLNGDGNEEIFISECRNDTAFLCVINWHENRIDRFFASSKPAGIKRPWRCHVSPVGMMDVNGDGYLDVILCAETFRAYQPRGVYAFDIHNRQILWRYLTGFRPLNVFFHDIDDDGKREILFGSTAPDNGEDAVGDDYIVNGTDDKHTYLTIIDSLGRLIRSQKVGDRFSHAMISLHDLNGDGGSECVVMVANPSHSDMESFAALWNPVSGNIGNRVKFEGRTPFRSAFMDADRDGNDDVLIAWDDGTLEFRDGRMKLIHSRNLKDFDLQYLAIHDLNNDSEKEIIVCGLLNNRHIIFTLDSKLRPLALLDEGIWINDHSLVNAGYGKNKRLLACEEKGILFLEMVRNPGAPLRLPWNWIGLGFLFGLIFSCTFILLMAKKRHRKSISSMLDSVFLSSQTAMLMLNANGEVISINHAMEKLLEKPEISMLQSDYRYVFEGSFLQDVITYIESSYQKDVSVLGQEIAATQNKTLSNYLLSVNTISSRGTDGMVRLVSIQDITDIVQSKRAIAWATMAQRLAHEVKTPLSTVMLSAQRLQTETMGNRLDTKVFDKYVERILRQVRRLQMLTDAFLKFARVEKPRFETVDFNGLVKQWIEKNRFRFGPEIKVDTLLGRDLPSISVDKEQIRTVLQNIVDNGLKAMDGKGTLTITTRLVQSLHTNQLDRRNHAIQLEIADTGKGISKEDLKELFKPFFSKSAGGTGLGLVLVKKIVEDHQGSIHIESEPDVGTRIIISLPVRRNRSSS